MKVVAVLGDAGNQRALANRMHAIVPLAHVARIRNGRRPKRRFLRSLVSLTLARSLRNAWIKTMRHYEERFTVWPDAPSSVHSSSNDEELIRLVERMKPDLVLVSGTDLVKKASLDRFATQVMNLHTGISPYIKGAPNCTNWALALKEFDLIGNTIMWIDPGIDSGAIITTEQTPLTGRESLADLHVAVMDHAHDLYCRAVATFVQGRNLPAVRQDEIDRGRLFLMRDWNGVAMASAAFNHRFFYRPFATRSNIRLIGLK